MTGAAYRQDGARCSETERLSQEKGELEKFRQKKAK